MLITALGNILADGPKLPPHVRRTASTFLTQQLMRPNGVLGLCESVFGEEETSGEAVKLDKLEHISKMLISVPAKMPPQVILKFLQFYYTLKSNQQYFKIMIPRIIQLLSNAVPASYRKIAAFTLSQVMGSRAGFQYQDIAAPMVYATLHRPFLQMGEGESQPSANEPIASTALSNILNLMANCDPSPELVSNLLSPIISPLYSLYFHLHSQKTADPQVKESVQGLLVTWGKIVDSSKAIDLLWSLIQNGEEFYWKVGLDGSITLIPQYARSLTYLLERV